MQKKPQSPRPNTDPPRAPLLLIGWGQEGVKDITAIRDLFPCDEALDCIDAWGATSDAVLALIERWLAGNPNAQFLYIGCHGNEKGLTPIGRPELGTPKISWSRLASALGKAKRPIMLWLGACASDSAADSWTTESSLPVDVIVGFSGDTITIDLKRVLWELVARSNLTRPDEKQEDDDFKYLPEDLAELPEKFRNITMHYKVAGHGYVDCRRFKETTGIEFAEYLDRKGRTKEGARLFHEALARVAATEAEVPATEEPGQRQPCENSGVRKLKFIRLTSK